MAKNNAKKSKSGLFIALMVSVLILYVLLMFIMVYLTLNTSLKEQVDYDIDKLNHRSFALTQRVWFKNYTEAFSAFSVPIRGNTYKVRLFEMLINSLIYAGGCSIIATIVPALVAYLVAKYKERFNTVIYTTVIVAMVLPLVGSLPSEIQVAKMFNLYNTRFGVVVLKATYLGMYFLIFHGTFKGLSDEYIEAATIDGAGQFTVMLKVVFPLVKTTIFAVILLNFINYWNEYQTPLIYMSDYPTAAVGLFKAVHMPGDSGRTDQPIQMAGCMILFLPIFALFVAFKDVFMGNLTVGGIKG